MVVNNEPGGQTFAMPGGGSDLEDGIFGGVDIPVIMVRALSRSADACCDDDTGHMPPQRCTFFFFFFPESPNLSRSWLYLFAF